MSIQVEVIVTTTNDAGGEVWKGHFYSAEHAETGVTLEGSASRHGYSWLGVKMAVDDTRSSMEYVKSPGCGKLGVNEVIEQIGMACSELADGFDDENDDCTTRRRGESS